MANDSATLQVPPAERTDVPGADRPLARDVAILGATSSRFGDLWERSFRDLIAYSMLDAIARSGVSADDVDAVFAGSMSAGRLIDQEHIGAVAVDEAGLADRRVPATRVEAGDATGAAALRAGMLAVASGAHDVVVVAGTEKVTDTIEADARETSITSADHEWEAFFGATLPGLYGMMARRHMHDHGTTREQLASVSVKNHAHGARNARAAFGFPVKLEAVLGSAPVAEPLHLLDCAAPCDGSAALVLAPAELAGDMVADPVLIAACEQASDTLALHARDELTSMAATRAAGRLAFERAGVGPGDIDVAELHDVFSIAEIVALEDLGFFGVGEAAAATEAGRTTYGGDVVVNPSGGLKSHGHALGATGLAQVVEIAAQLRGETGERQVEGASVGLAHSVGGTGGTAIVSILRPLENGR